MRVISVSTENVGGVTDGTVTLPSTRVLAMAGANGTGKSKLLACILAPWSGQVPGSPIDGARSLISVEVDFTPLEQSALSDLSAEVGWGEVEVPTRVTLGVARDTYGNTNRSSTPELAVLNQFFFVQNFLQQNPTLDVVYLPAERRLLEPRQQGIDLSQLSDAVAFQKNSESRATVNNYGRLDDQEFEDFAKALCVASTLPVDKTDEELEVDIVINWEDFLAAVNALIFPKTLLPLTRSHPDALRVRTPSGATHPVRDLSSGERQALIIISRVFRLAGTTPLILIDEPDAYLHPTLSKKLLSALEDGMSLGGQLIIATHSPSLLDGLPASDILRLEYGNVPHPVADEGERLELYRDAGFRSSALTQADLLVVTEGETDISLLSIALPELGAAASQSAGGKEQVIRTINQLKAYDLPIIGIIDRDVIKPVEDANIYAWPTADIEGLFLTDPALQVMIDSGLLKESYRDLGEAHKLVHELCMEQRENVLTEIARDRCVSQSGYEWPSPKGENAMQRLRDAVAHAKPISSELLEAEFDSAQVLWDQQSEEPLTLVRGKYILSKFNSIASEMKNGRVLIETVARLGPRLDGLEQLTSRIRGMKKLNAS